MRSWFGGLWRHPDFLALWAGHSISLVGSQVTLLALPLVAILSLEATPVQMGLLAAAGSLPALLFGLLVGVWVDRRRRRPLLVASDLGRGVLLLAIPAAALFGWLGIEVLYVVAFLIGSLGLVSGVAAQSFLPALVGRQHLIEANSKLEVSRSAAEIAGPGLAGGLIQLLTAPLAIIVDAASFVLSGLLIGCIQTHEPPPAPPAPGRRLRREIADGLLVVLANPILRPLAGATALVVFWNSVLEAAFLLYVTRDLTLTPALLGTVFAVGSIGFLVGALVAERLTRRLGVGPTLIVALVTTGLADLAVPLVGGAPVVVALVLIAAQFFFGLGLLVYNITAVSLRQSSTPDHLLGRMNASMRFLVFGLTPLGSLIGGLLGESVGLRPTLFLAVAGELLAALWLVGSPVRALRQPPAPSDHTALAELPPTS